jgi:nucleoside-diphosphate-sugar epimerase
MECDVKFEGKPQGHTLMIVGSGLLARAFADAYSQRDDVCIYAAGVSNSACKSSDEFARERQRLTDALRTAHHVGVFVYFGTCSVADPDAQDTPYVQHKLAMEGLVQAHPQGLVIRLPQVAGKTPNPHTLLNYLYARISRSERFELWAKAKRNIIDVIDVAAIANCLIADGSARKTTINVANTASYPMPDIVHAMERTIGKQALFDATDRGSEYPIDVERITPVLGKAGVDFDNTYLDKVIGKYYGETA